MTSDFDKEKPYHLSVLTLPLGKERTLRHLWLLTTPRQEVDPDMLNPDLRAALTVLPRDAVWRDAQTSHPVTRLLGRDLDGVLLLPWELDILPQHKEALDKENGQRSTSNCLNGRESTMAGMNG